MNKRQQVFIETYLQGWNATKAALAAGYSERSARQQGSRLLSNADIKAEIDARLAEMQVSANEALSLLATHARSSIGQFVSVSKAGTPRFNFADATPEQWRGIKTLEIVPGEGGTRYRVEMYDSQAAIREILKQHALANGKATDIVQVVVNGIIDPDTDGD